MTDNNHYRLDAQVVDAQRLTSGIPLNTTNPVEIRSILPNFPLLLPSQNPFLRKEGFMKDPSGGRGPLLPIFESLGSFVKDVKAESQGLPDANTQSLHDNPQSLQILDGKVDRSFPNTTHTNIVANFGNLVGDYRQSDSTSESTTPKPLLEVVQSASPLDWILNPDKQRSLADRVMARLIQAEAHEENIHFREDYRQTFIFLSRISHGMDPLAAFLSSSYTMYGLHPLKVWEKRMHDRRILLGKEFPEWCDDAGNFRPDIPKKPTLAQEPLPAPAGAVLPTPQTPKPAPVPFPKKETA